MSTRRHDVFLLALVLSAVGACSDDTMAAFPEEDASDQDGPTFDIPITDGGGIDAGTDRGPSSDPGTPDRGTSETTICPANCAASAECDPCRTSDTPSTVAYCCISGLCVSMTGTCPAMGDGGTPDTPPGDSPEGGTDASDPFDDVDGVEDTGTPPADVGPVSDLGRADGSGDATAGDAAVGDATADAATVDAAVSMDAADGRD